LESFDFHHIVSIYTTTFYQQFYQKNVDSETETKNKEFYDLFPSVSYKRGDRWIHSVHPFLSEIKCSKPMTFVDARSDNKNRLISSCMRLFALMKETFVTVTEANKKMQSIAYGFLKTVCIAHDMISALSQKQILNQKRVEREQILNQKRVEREQILNQKRVEREQKKAYKEYEILQKQADKEQVLAKKRVERESILSQKQADKEQVLAKKRVERESILSQKRVERESILSQKQADKEQVLAKKQADKEQVLFVKHSLKKDAILFAKLQTKNKALALSMKKKEAADKTKRETHAFILLQKLFSGSKILRKTEQSVVW
jgi:hypothetical protein